MDLFVLDPDTFYPGHLIIGYDSLIWTERFLEAGEFELKSYDIPNTLAKLPKKTLVSHRDTREVMMVESCTISTDDDGIKTITVKGRTLETFLEQRVIQMESGHTYKMLQDYSSMGAAEVLIWNALVSTSAQDVVTNFLERDPLDHVPNLIVTQKVAPGLDTKSWYVETGYVYPKVIEILARDDLGIRCIRPKNDIDYDDPTIVTKVTVSTSGLDIGTITRDDINNVKKLQINIYDGTDKSEEGTELPNDRIIFSYHQGYLGDPEYLFTINVKKNVGFWATTESFETSYYDLGADTLEGLDRRYLLIDFGSDLGTASPAMENSARQKTEARVKRRRAQFFFNASASETIPYSYKGDYDLGDKVTLIAEYGTNVTATITEFVSTEDAEGERGFPTLVVDT